MAGHGRLRELWERSNELACGPLAFGKKVQDGPPGWFSHGFKDIHAT
jgi:hypothetical protein